MEKYGSVDGFGLKNGTRIDDGEKTEDGRVGLKGRRNWVRELGFVSPGRHQRPLSTARYYKEGTMVIRSGGGADRTASYGGSFGLLPRSRIETVVTGREATVPSRQVPIRLDTARGESTNAVFHGGEINGETLPSLDREPWGGVMLDC